MAGRHNCYTFREDRGLAMSLTRAALLSVAGPFLLSACALLTPSEPDISGTIEASVKGTIEARPSAPPPTVAEIPSQAPSPTGTPTIEPSLTPTPLAAKVSVSQITNCRTGPGTKYPLVLALRPGQVAAVTARSAVEDYWYIANPDDSDEFCWLWGEHAVVEGDVGRLPVLTPEASPVPQIDFILYRHSISECGSRRVALIVINNSATTFNSARIHVEDLTTSEDLYGPKTDPKPFGDNPSSCPKDKGSESLLPGATAYIVVPMSPVEAGNDAVAHVKLCTGDDGGGSCVTKSAYFRLPEG